MEEAERVRVLSFAIHQVRQEVVWIIERASGDHIPMVWPIPEFGKTWGIRETIPEATITEFSQKMVGKEVNLIIRKQEASDGDGENLRQP